MIVVDTNVIAYLHLPGAFTTLAEQVVEKDGHWVVPYLWRSEFRNILALYLRRGEIVPGEARRVMKKAERLLQDQEFHLVSDRILDLVLASSCSAYDCEFVALAQELDLPLVTADQRILRDFPETAVSLQQFTTA